MEQKEIFFFELYRLKNPLRSLFLIFTLVLTCGVSVGIVYIYHTTQMTPKGTVERYNGSDLELTEEEDFDIPENYAKPFSELLITTHNHINSLSLLFFIFGLVFSGSTLIGGFWKTFLMTETLVAVLTTFGSIWAMRYIHPSFAFITIGSGILMYSSFYVMSAAVLWELFSKKRVIKGI